MGKYKPALNLLSNDSSGGLLHLDDPVDATNPDSPTVKQALISKHPEGQPAYNSCIIPSEPEDPHPIIFDSLNADAIHSVALKVNSAAGPRVNAYGWRRLCTCFKDAPRNLCEALVSTAERICSTYPTFIAPLLACRLIALDKNPGIHPIGIGEITILFIVKPDIQYAVECL